MNRASSLKPNGPLNNHMIGENRDVRSSGRHSGSSDARQWDQKLEAEMWDLRQELSRQMFEAANRAPSSQLEKEISASRKRLSRLETIRRGASK